MLQDRRYREVDHTDEGRGAVARPERVIGDAFLDLALRLASDVQRPVAVSIAPHDRRQLGIDHGCPIQLAR